MRISAVFALAVVVIVFQNCSFQSGGIQMSPIGSSQANQSPTDGFDQPVPEPVPVDVNCNQIQNAELCKNSLKLQTVEGIGFTKIDTSLESLQTGTLRKIVTVFQISNSWPEYRPNQNGAVFKVTTSNLEEDAVFLPEFQFECFIDQVKINSICRADYLQAPLFNDFNVHTFSVKVSSVKFNFEKTFSILVARWQQMDNTAAYLSALNNQISVLAGSVVQSRDTAQLISIANGATLILKSTPRFATIRLENEAQFLLDSAIGDTGTVLELKESSRSYIMGALYNATIKAKPGAVIFSDSIVQDLKIELLP